MPDARHHKASRDVQVIFVPVLVAFEGGSPKHGREVKPGRYPHQERQPWRPQRAIPNRKAEGFKRTLDLLRELDRHANEARAMLTPTAGMLRSAP